PSARGWFKETGSWWGAAPRRMVVECEPRCRPCVLLPRFKARRPAGDADRPERDLRSGGATR
ncbi:hypothetical protein PIB30_116245, partial [Stylosanthes scabra]|nr:hypothetical protein [Stylosanthes scabra]